MNIDYQLLIDEAMLSVVRKILIKIQNEGLYGDQSFYISFRTDYPDVILSKHIRKKFPEEITIILQHQYENLKVSDNGFSVNLTFNGIDELVSVPFTALTSFVDPSIDFGLQFRNYHQNTNSKVKSLQKSSSSIHVNSKTKNVSQNSKEKLGEVISIDKFRKKSK